MPTNRPYNRDARHKPTRKLAAPALTDHCIEFIFYVAKHPKKGVKGIRYARLTPLFHYIE